MISGQVFPFRGRGMEEDRLLGDGDVHDFNEHTVVDGTFEPTQPCWNLDVRTHERWSGRHVASQRDADCMAIKVHDSHDQV